MELDLSKQGAYALRTVLDLASHPLQLRKRREIAAATSSSPKTLANVLSRLRQAGLVEASAGPRGGYHLARSPGEISVLDVVVAVEGELLDHVCPLRETPCDGSCAVHVTWRGAQESLVDRLRTTTLAEVVRDGRPAA